MTISAVLLAAGKGTRMHSSLPKMLHPLGGKAMLLHSLNTLSPLTDDLPVVVVGHEADEIKAMIGERAQFVLQAEQLGTGHAVMQAEERLKGNSSLVLVAYGDMPLVRAESFQALIDLQQANDGPLSMLSIVVDNPRGFGRVLRNAAGDVTAIVEEADCTAEQREIRELNVGVYCMDATWLWSALPRIELSAKGEYYLTDLVAIASGDGGRVQAIVLEDAREAIGINNRVHLAEAEAILRERINTRWMEAGVTIKDPSTTYIDAEASIGQDTLIEPNTHISGTTSIGAHCTIGPNTFIHDSQIGDHCTLFASMVEQARLEDHVDIGPYAHLRKGAHLAAGVHMGNFGEVKNAYLGPGVKMGHFSYIGDATIHDNVNIGAGTITANYDGVNKNHTEIGEDAFIGSDTMLVAPLKIGARARTGAGSVVTKDVPEDTVVVGIPARAVRKLNKRE